MTSALLLAETPWALMPEVLSALVEAATSGTSERSSEILAGAGRNRTNEMTGAGNGSIMVLPVHGIVTQRGNVFDAIFGGGSVSTQQLSAMLRSALADDTVRAIILDISSPGGEVYGVEELASEILAARSQKPIIAYANCLAASAAYWIGSQASEFWAAPSSEVGSIGVFAAHRNLSKAMEQIGIKTTFISAGKFKTEGNSYEALSEEAQAHMQSRVNDYYGAFVKAVSKGRNAPVAQVRDGMGQGRVLGASAAKAAGMIDGVGSFDQVVQSVVRGRSLAAARIEARRRELVPEDVARTPSFRVANERRRLDLLGD